MPLEDRFDFTTVPDREHLKSTITAEERQTALSILPDANEDEVMMFVVGTRYGAMSMAFKLAEAEGPEAVERLIRGVKEGLEIH